MTSLSPEAAARLTAEQVRERRAGWLEMLKWAEEFRGFGTRQTIEAELERRYPLPPRIERDPHGLYGEGAPTDVCWKVLDSQHGRQVVMCDEHGKEIWGEREVKRTPERVRLWSDLLKNPKGEG